MATARRLSTLRILLLAPALGGMVGCNPLSESVPAAWPEAPQAADAPRTEGDVPLAARLDRALQTSFDRKLNLQDHAAWQILHGALAFGDRFLVARSPGGEVVSAVDHLLAGGSMVGWDVEPGTILDKASGRRGLRALMEPGSKSGQGHHDQWFAVLAQCGLEPDQTIRYGEHRFTMADFVAQVQWDLPRNLEQEFSWTLIGLTSYLPTDATWIASDGQTWSIERLVRAELEQDLASGACGGTHRLIGLAMALNQHLAADGELTGAWRDADEQIQNAIRIARELQNSDGSFSSNYFQRPGHSTDLAQDLGTSGHILEFLAVATTTSQLSEPWIEQGVLHLCDVFEKTANLPLECGALYHAAHGLALYKERRSGPDGN